jgi:NAD(P) transhydrogenase subunit alpha
LRPRPERRAGQDFGYQDFGYDERRSRKRSLLGAASGGKVVRGGRFMKGRYGVAVGTLLAMAVPMAVTGSEGGGAGSPPGTDFVSMLFVFMLATFIGLGVIMRVSRLLHTPLMSLTNAISAIAVVGSLVITGADHPAFITVMGAIALFASMTNIVSGFLITDRMLKMFRKQDRSSQP